MDVWQPPPTCHGGGLERDISEQEMMDGTGANKKLYDEVKAGGSTQKIYKRKCSQLRNKDMRREVNWCSKCKRKLGLIGFRYRCGNMFCSNHRYSDRHECRFDYKAAGRAMIAKENPVVKPARILKV
eukprot:XP_010645797.1 PREDICTED: zinc finger A20 and AN1 domain-containing stress-associated protein 5-like [Vitis vinifera]